MQKKALDRIDSLFMMKNSQQSRNRRKKFHTLFKFIFQKPRPKIILNNKKKWKA